MKRDAPTPGLEESPRRSERLSGKKRQQVSPKFPTPSEQSEEEKHSESDGEISGWPATEESQQISENNSQQSSFTNALREQVEASRVSVRHSRPERVTRLMDAAYLDNLMARTPSTLAGMAENRQQFIHHTKMANKWRAKLKADLEALRVSALNDSDSSDADFCYGHGVSPKWA